MIFRVADWRLRRSAGIQGEAAARRIAVRIA